MTAKFKLESSTFTFWRDVIVQYSWNDLNVFWSCSRSFCAALHTLPMLQTHHKLHFWIIFWTSHALAWWCNERINSMGLIMRCYQLCLINNTLLKVIAFWCECRLKVLAWIIKSPQEKALRWKITSIEFCRIKFNNPYTMDDDHSSINWQANDCKFCNRWAIKTSHLTRKLNA